MLKRSDDDVLGDAHEKMETVLVGIQEPYKEKGKERSSVKRERKTQEPQKIDSQEETHELPNREHCPCWMEIKRLTAETIHQPNE